MLIVDLTVQYVCLFLLELVISSTLTGKLRILFLADLDFYDSYCTVSQCTNSWVSSTIQGNLATSISKTTINNSVLQ